ncbi:MAG: lipopolysaccharide biosynthesis protein [Proteobacteria bacterium]|nr:lipopolysaccharide biosynthesis protein [Pseudomonadota bacterium]
MGVWVMQVASPSLTGHAAVRPYASDTDIDMAALGRAIWRRRRQIIVPTLIVGLLSAIAVNFLTPKYKSEARVLYEGRENIFLRPEADKATQDRGVADQEAVTSQVQLVLSRELAVAVVRQLKLNELPEFDPLLHGVSLLKSMLITVGIARDPTRMTAEERVLDAYYERLVAYPIDRTRVIVVEFQSSSPDLAARVTNAIAERYLGLQQVAKQDQTRAAGRWLAGEIESLRTKVSEAENKADAFRSNTNLFVGTNNTTLSNQQLGEFNTQLGTARAQKADAEVRARLIREVLQKGGAVESTDIVNSELIRRLAEQRVTLLAQLAEQSATLLDRHPRIKELRAQIADLDRQIRVEGEKLARALENDARIAGAKVETLSANLDQLKRQAASTNVQDVQFRALEREAKAQRELLESYLARYRETTARDSIGAAPADARIISRGIVSNTPFFPKKLPIILVASLATFVLSTGFVLTGELLRNVRGTYSSAFDGTDTEPVARPSLDGGARAVPHRVLGVSVDAIDAVARALRAAGGVRCAVVTAVGGNPTPIAALTIGRALSKEYRTLLVDLAPTSPNAGREMGHAGGAGINDLVLGAASFGTIISRDPLSRMHVVAPGSPVADRAAMLASARLATAFAAFNQTYDFVLINGGPVGDLEVGPIGKIAVKAVLLCDAAEDDATAAATRRLQDGGIAEIVVLVGRFQNLASGSDQPVAA